MTSAKHWFINISKKHAFNPRLRYSMMEWEENYYLIDNDQAWWGYISPILTWMIPETIMRVNLSKEEIEALLLDREGVEKSAGAINLGKGVAIFISLVLGPPVLFPLINHFLEFQIPVLVNLLISSAIIVGMLILKRRISRSAIGLIDIIGKENLTETKVILVPSSLWQKVKILILRMIFFIITMFLFMYLFTEGNQMNFMGWLAGIFGLFMIIYPNTFLRVFSKYRIKMID